jgi:hypothetical protein
VLAAVFLFFCSSLRINLELLTFYLPAMSEVLTSGGIELALSLSSDNDRVPLTLQVLEVANVTNNISGTSSVARVEAKLSDGKYFSHVVLSKKLHPLVSSKQLTQGALVEMTNYISQPVDGAKNVIICLDLTVVGSSELIYGDPLEYSSSSVPTELHPTFVGTDVVGLCNHCEEDPCDWSTLGRTIVESVRAEHSSTTLEGATANKSYRFAAYRTYARVKFGYLGKGNRKPLPICVTKGIRDNFPDPQCAYVGFQPTNEDD